MKNCFYTAGLLIRSFTCAQSPPRLYSMKNITAKIALLFSLFYIPTANAFEIKFSCSPYDKSGTEADFKISGADVEDLTALVPITAKAQKIKIGKSVYKNLKFKGERSHSARGAYFEIEADPVHKVIKSIFVAANPSGEQLGQDELLTTDGTIYKMSCHEQQGRAATGPSKKQEIGTPKSERLSQGTKMKLLKEGIQQLKKKHSSQMQDAALNEKEFQCSEGEFNLTTCTSYYQGCASTADGGRCCSQISIVIEKDGDQYTLGPTSALSLEEACKKQ